MDYYVYVLQSLFDHKQYIGLSSDIHKRLKMHNSGKVKSSKGRRPFILIYQEKVGTLSEARKREKYFKSAAGRYFLLRLNLKNYSLLVRSSLPDC
jgi:putative endonuclease